MNTVPEVKVTAAAALAIIAEKFLPEGNREKVSKVGVAVNKIVALQRERPVAFWDQEDLRATVFKFIECRLGQGLICHICLVQCICVQTIAVAKEYKNRTFPGHLIRLVAAVPHLY